MQKQRVGVKTSHKFMDIICGRSPRRWSSAAAAPVSLSASAGGPRRLSAVSVAEMAEVVEGVVAMRRGTIQLSKIWLVKPGPDSIR